MEFGLPTSVQLRPVLISSSMRVQVPETLQKRWRIFFRAKQGLHSSQGPHFLQLGLFRPHRSVRPSVAFLGMMREVLPRPASITQVVVVDHLLVRKATSQKDCSDLQAFQLFRGRVRRLLQLAQVG